MAGRNRMRAYRVRRDMNKKCIKGGNNDLRQHWIWAVAATAKRYNQHTTAGRRRRRRRISCWINCLNCSQTIVCNLRIYIPLCMYVRWMRNEMNAAIIPECAQRIFVISSPLFVEFVAYKLRSSYAVYVQQEICYLWNEYILNGEMFGVRIGGGRRNSIRFVFILI